MKNLWDRIAVAMPQDSEKVIATVVALLVGVLLSRLWAKYLAGEGASNDKRRKLVWAKNAIWATIFFVIVSVWASKIAGFALSLAAVAGAMLIVSKELLMCVLGYGYATFVRPFRIGDFVEIGATAGRIIDIDMFSTTVAEFGPAGQLTGKTADVPNGVLLTTPVRNLSATGTYIVHVFKMPVPEKALDNLESFEKVALEAALRITRPWQDRAERHFRKLSEDSFLELPSVKPKILWDFTDPKHILLVVRVACPPGERLNVEQEVFKTVWKSIPEG